MVALLMTMGFAFSATEGKIDHIEQPQAYHGYHHHHHLRYDQPQADWEEGAQGEDCHALHPHDPRQDHHHHLPHQAHC